MNSVMKEVSEVQNIWESVFKTNEFERFFNESALYNAFAEATVLKVDSKVVHMLLEKQDILEVKVDGEKVVIKRKSRVEAEYPSYHLVINDKDGFHYFYEKDRTIKIEIEANVLIREIFNKCF